MKNLSVFQAALLSFFGVVGIAGIFFLATFRGDTGTAQVGAVVVWGTFDQKVGEGLLSALREEDKGFSGVEYVEKDARTFDNEFVNALATGAGPDIILLPHEDILKHRDKIVPISYEAFSLRNFRNTFVEGGEIYAFPEGIMAFPFLVDPLVMYYNRSIFTENGIAEPPRLWEEFFVLAPKISKRGEPSNIQKSFVAFGEFQNVRHAKEILSMLILQAGNPIVEHDAAGRMAVALGGASGYSAEPAQSALRFYTEFSNPVKSVYSWNRSLSESRQHFISGDLAVYFGFASELGELKELNPNLNFDVAPVPQIPDRERRLTFARFEGLALARGSGNPEGALLVMEKLVEPPYVSYAAGSLALPPVRRDLLAQVPSDAVGPVFYQSALEGTAWLDPQPEQTSAIFRSMIEDTVTGRRNLGEAVSSAASQIRNLIP